jgi:hypothetical protein
MRERALDARQVARTEEIDVIQQVIEVVQLAAQRVSGVERPRAAVGRHEVLAKATKKLGHREIHLSIADVHGGIEHDASAVSERCRVARPQVAVDERRYDVVAAQKRR